MAVLKVQLYFIDPGLHFKPNTRSIDFPTSMNLKIYRLSRAGVPQCQGPMTFAGRITLCFTPLFRQSSQKYFFLCLDIEHCLQSASNQTLQTNSIHHASNPFSTSQIHGFSSPSLILNYASNHESTPYTQTNHWWGVRVWIYNGNQMKLDGLCRSKLFCFENHRPTLGMEYCKWRGRGFHYWHNGRSGLISAVVQHFLARLIGSFNLGRRYAWYIIKWPWYVFVKWSMRYTKHFCAAGQLLSPVQ